jgi:uncharacterized membrane protein
VTLSALGAAHFAASLAALALGLAVILERKGTSAHRTIGASYAVAMMLLNVTALGVHRLTGSFGPFHALALVSLAILARGIAATWRRRAGGLKTHYYSMAWSYVSLLAAAAAEVAGRVPLGLVQNARDGMTIGLVCAAVFTLVGFIVVPRLEKRVLATASTR